MDAEAEQRMRDIQREYLDFLDDEEDQGVYIKLVREMISRGEIRLIVNINDLRRKLPARALNLLQSGFEEIIAFQRALREIVTNSDPNYGKKHEEFFVGFEGSFGVRHVSPRTLTSKYLGSMVCCEGIVTKCSLIRPKVVRSVHYCPATRKTMERSYQDLTSMEAFPSSAVYPTKDDDGNLLETEYGLSFYKDHQSLSIQEMPEKAPAGQLPRSVDVIVDDDLVDACKPGDRVQIVGMFRCLPGKQGGFTSGSFRTIIIANHVALLSKEVIPHITVKDVRNCKKVARYPNWDVFDLLARSLAPSIHGHEYVKKAILCMLLGGVEKILPNGTRLRGDINILLIGDPSVAKSQLLRYVLQTAPRAIPTTGRGSSGVGLTAAVTSDQETKERRLEAGAMVLADRGVVCIDEFDKMTDLDRTAIHEVMEQGRVTISKAGIHARLNARCSVLAAANPVYGRYDQYKTPMENIGMQDSLLSRFDLLFILLDHIDPENDREIANHVARVHQFRAAGEQDGEAMPLGSTVDILSTRDPQKETAEEEEGEEGRSGQASIFEKEDALRHRTRGGRKEKLLSFDFVRKYIHLARTLKPGLTQEACDVIAEEYSRLRGQDQDSDVAKTQPVTARLLETLIRLSTAHAKARLSKLVSLEDAHNAIELVQFALFKKVLEKSRKRRRGGGREGGESSADESEDGGDDGGDDDDQGPRKKRKEPGDEGYDPYDIENEMDENDRRALRRRRRKRTSTGDGAPEEPSVATAAPEEEATDAEILQGASEVFILESRFKVFMESLSAIYRERRVQSIPVAEVRTELAKRHPDQPFTANEMGAAIERMQNDNKIMLSEGSLYLI